MKRFLHVCTAVMLALCLLAGCTPAAAPAAPDPAPATAAPPPAPTPEPAPEPLFTAGTYIAKTPGLWDDITVQVNLTDTEIEDIFILHHKETQAILEAVDREMIAKICESQSLAVDTVAGATYTSGAILTAIQDCMTQAGADIDALKAVPADYPVNTADQEYDVVVVGAGVSGMSAAISLGRDSDLNVLLLEAVGYTGGSGLVSGGAIWATGSVYSTLHENNWDADTLVALTAERSLNADVNEALIRKVAGISGPYFDYLIENGVPWNYGVCNTATVLGESPVGFYPGPAHPAQRGEAIMQAYNRIVEENGVEIRLNSLVTELIVNNGAVEGVVVQNRDGSTYNVRAQKVVLSTGGYGRNEEYMELYNPKYTGHVYAAARSMGDAITLTRELGTYHVNEGVSGAAGVDVPHGYCNWAGAAGSYSWTSPGNVFVDVEGNVMEAYHDLLTVKDKVSYRITGQDNDNLVNIDQALAHGFGYRADTYEALADMIGNIDKEAFLASMAAFEEENGALLAPYTAIVGRYTFYATLGGLSVDDNCQPLVEATGAAIPNLYVTGEAMMGSVMSHGYTCTGSAIAYGTYTGKIASDHIIGEIG